MVSTAGLVIVCDGCTLRPPSDSELAFLARAASRPGAVLAPEQSHYVTWLRGRTQHEVAAELTARVAANRDLRGDGGWVLELAVFVDGRPVGMQSVTGSASWAADRAVGTSSWLLAPFQGRGIGLRSRAAVLELAFGTLGVETAKSWVLAENRASTAVSGRLGYEVVDRHRIVEDGGQYEELVFAIDRAAWLRSGARREWPAVVEGAEALAGALGGALGGA